MEVTPKRERTFFPYNDQKNKLNLEFLVINEIYT